jgi:hypothetical protein
MLTVHLLLLLAMVKVGRAYFSVPAAAYSCWSGSDLALLRPSLVHAVRALLLLPTPVFNGRASGVLYTSCPEPALATAAACCSSDYIPNSANVTVSALLCDKCLPGVLLLLLMVLAGPQLHFAVQVQLLLLLAFPSNVQACVCTGPWIVSAMPHACMWECLCNLSCLQGMLALISSCDTSGCLDSLPLKT